MFEKDLPGATQYSEYPVKIRSYILHPAEAGNLVKVCHVNEVEKDVCSFIQGA